MTQNSFKNRFNFAISLSFALAAISVALGRFYAPIHGYKWLEFWMGASTSFFLIVCLILCGFYIEVLNFKPKEE